MLELTLGILACCIPWPQGQDQQPAPALNTGRAMGRVLNVLGEPILAEVIVRDLAGIEVGRGQTDAEGQFVVGRLPTDVTVSAVAAGFIGIPQPAIALPLGTAPGAAPLVVRVLATAPFRGAVVDERGRPVRGAVIRAMRRSTDPALLMPLEPAISAADGSFELPSVPVGPITLYVTHPDHRARATTRWASQAQGMPEILQPVPATHTIALSAEAPRRVHIDVDTERLEGDPAGLLALPRIAPLPSGPLEGRPDLCALMAGTAIPGADGKRELAISLPSLEDLGTKRTGDLRVAPLPPHRSNPAQARVPRDETGVAVITLVPSRTVPLRGVLTDTAHRPLQQQVVRATERGTKITRTAVTDDAGRFAIDFVVGPPSEPRPRGAPSQPRSLGPRSQGAGPEGRRSSASIRLVRSMYYLSNEDAGADPGYRVMPALPFENTVFGAGIDLHIRARRGTALSGQLFDDSQQPLADCELTVLDGFPGFSERRLVQGCTDRQGKFTLVGIPPTRPDKQVFYRIDGPAYRAHGLIEGPLGEPARWQADRGGAVEGVLVDQRGEFVGGAELKVRVTALNKRPLGRGAERRCFSDGQGRFRISCPSGRVSVTCALTGSSARTIVRAGESALLELEIQR